MSDTFVVEEPLRVRIAKKIRTLYPSGKPLSLPFLSERLVTEAAVVWGHVNDAWHPEMVEVVSSVPRRDGRPSALSKSHFLNPGERLVFLNEFPDAARPPAERITVNIERPS